MSDWRTMESAPRDGTPILVMRRRPDLNDDKWPHGLLAPEVVIAVWRAYWEMPEEPCEWLALGPRDLDGSRSIVRLEMAPDFHKAFPGVGPTHWMPLPSPPESIE